MIFSLSSCLFLLLLLYHENNNFVNGELNFFSLKTSSKSLANQQQRSFKLYNLNPDIFRQTPQLIESRGFLAETHRITTDDGYILSVFRVINPFVRNSSSIRPVILWHGIGVNSDSWLLSTDGHLNSNGTYIENGHIVNDCNETVTNTLAFTLASCGYDVWLPNTRGGHYSDGHISYHQQPDDYWRFSLTELAIFDIPAVVAYILRTTRKKSLAYVGHSLGTDQMFALQSLIPESGELFRPFIALAPVAYLGNIWSMARFGVPLEPILKAFPGPVGLPMSIMQVIGILICGNDLLVDLCQNALYSINGFDSYNSNSSIIPARVAHSAEISSSWLYAHLAQMVSSGQYQMMDFGPEQNLQRYGQLTPPKYPLGQISSTNIALFRGQNDPLADGQDVQNLVQSLNVTLLDDYIVPFEKWNHQDFQVAISQGFYVNRRLLRILRMFDHE